jgi:predicted TIM-barrel fold metal-dependent hydrolase
VIDDHAHPFPLAREPLDPDAVTLDVSSGPAAQDRRRELGPGRLAGEMLRVRLAGYLGCAVPELEAAREDAARDWPSYVAGLFADVGLTGMLLDPGAEAFPAARGVAPYAELAAVPMWELVRVEPLVDRLMAAGARALEIRAAVDDLLDGAAAQGAVGVKTVLAYRTGLAVDPDVSVLDADRSLDDVATPVRRRAKALRDLMFRHLLARCADLRLPLQVHTGFGDSEISPAQANPLLLDDVLRTPEAAAARVVLIHGGFPWHEQVAYLAAVRPSVWVDLSLSNLVSPATTADRLLRLIDLTPTRRLLLGSDGHGPPETHWFALGVLRDSWSLVRDRLGGVARTSWLDDVERDIFADNARRLYDI